MSAFYTECRLHNQSGNQKVETDCVGNLYTRHCLITEAILSTIVDQVKVPSTFRWRTKG